MSTRIIGVAGLAGSGKDTVGSFLNLIGFQRFAFADKLRESLLTLNPYVGLTKTGMIRLRQVVSEIGWPEAKKNPEVRRLLQVFGTEVMREMFDDDVWIKTLESDIQKRKTKKVVITDVRFENEARWVHEMGGENWIVSRPDNESAMPMAEENKKHVSERLNIPSYLFDIQIANTGTLDDLKRHVLFFGNRPTNENRKFDEPE